MVLKSVKILCTLINLRTVCFDRRKIREVVFCLFKTLRAKLSCLLDALLAQWYLSSNGDLFYVLAGAVFSQQSPGESPASCPGEAGIRSIQMISPLLFFLDLFICKITPLIPPYNINTADNF